ncbi:MAG: riboflavin biosynthesis protein RibF [Clostridiales bacterium]|nr:riboflavin biosynthesis protein RibF [Clostridiales bacterium]
MLEIIEYNKDEYAFPCLIVLGCFDAIHEGHRELFKKAKLQAKINGLDLGVMMFYGGKGGKQVFTFEERVKFLEQYNVKFVLKIDFNDEFKKIKPLDFLANIEDKLNVKAYMSGKDFRFGAGAKGKSSTLKKYAEDEENGVWYMSVKDVLKDGEKISTTLIKSCLEQGDIQKANGLLGSKFHVCGKVVNGAGRGTSLGFPTVNIAYPQEKYEVKHGVYKVEAEVEGVLYQGVANYGPRPTFDESAPVLEVYLHGYNGDLYGKDLIVCFNEYIRDVQKFESSEALIAQLAKDVESLGAIDEIAVAEEVQAVNIVEEAPAKEELVSVEEQVIEPVEAVEEIAEPIEEVQEVVEVEAVEPVEEVQEAVAEVIEEVVEVQEAVEEAEAVEEISEGEIEAVEIAEEETTEEVVEAEEIAEPVETVEEAETTEPVEEIQEIIEEEHEFVNPDCIGCASIEYCTCKDKPECECNDVCEDCVCNLCTEEKCSQCACDDCTEETCTECLKNNPYDETEEAETVEIIEEANAETEEAEVIEESNPIIEEEIIEEVAIAEEETATEETATEEVATEEETVAEATEYNEEALTQELKTDETEG